MGHPAKEVHSVGRALAILESLTSLDRELGVSYVSEIASITGLVAGTVHRLLATLLYHGYVRQNRNTRFTRFIILWLGAKVLGCISGKEAGMPRFRGTVG